jgi:hypothetical protein
LWNLIALEETVGVKGTEFGDGSEQKRNGNRNGGVWYLLLNLAHPTPWRRSPIGRLETYIPLNKKLFPTFSHQRKQKSQSSRRWGGLMITYLHFAEDIVDFLLL